MATVATVATPPTHRRQDCFHPSCLCCCCCCCCGCDPPVGTGAAEISSSRSSTIPVLCPFVPVLVNDNLYFQSVLCTYVHLEDSLGPPPTGKNNGKRRSFWLFFGVFLTTHTTTDDEEAIKANDTLSLYRYLGTILYPPTPYHHISSLSFIS